MHANIIYTDKICKKKITEIKNVLIFLWKIYRWAKMQSNQWIVCGVYAYIIVAESQPKQDMMVGREMKIRVRAEIALRIICEMRIGDHAFS